MADISKLKLDNAVYNIKDSYAREMLAQISDPMIFKGTVGTNGTVVDLPSASASTIGNVYKVITAGTYAGQTAKVGDLFICNDTLEWVLVPSGDDVSGTVTNVATGTGLTGGPITTSGTISVDFNSVQSKLVSGTDIKTINNQSLLGSGNISIQSELTAGDGIDITNNVVSNEAGMYLGDDSTSGGTNVIDADLLGGVAASNYATVTSLANKQDTLVSGTNIKTINNQSLLGSGNINIQASGTIDSAMSDSSENAVQNKAIKAYVDSVILTSTDDGNGTVTISVSPSSLLNADTTGY